MRRAAASDPLPSSPTTWKEALGEDDTINDIAHLNILSDAGYSPPRKWSQHLSRMAEHEFIPALQRTVDTYGTRFDLTLVDKLEELLSDEMLSRIFRQLHAIDSLPREAGQELRGACVFYDPGMRGILKQFINRVLHLVDVYNATGPSSPIQFYPKDFTEPEAPRLGQGRIAEELLTSE